MTKRKLLKDCDFGDYSKEEAFLIAKLNGINAQAFLARMKADWDVEIAMTMPVKEKPRETQIVNLIPMGTTVNQWKRKCKANNVKWSTFYHRVYSNHWDCELACSLQAKETPDMVTIRKKFHFWKKIGGEWQRMFEWVTFKTSAAEYYGEK